MGQPSEYHQEDFLYWFPDSMAIVLYIFANYIIAMWLCFERLNLKGFKLKLSTQVSGFNDIVLRLLKAGADPDPQSQVIIVIVIFK